MLRRLFIAAVLAASVTACNGGSTNVPPFTSGVFVSPSPSPTPSPTPVPQHLYVGNDNPAAQIEQFTIPITATSTPNFTLTAGGNVVSLGLDATGDLAVGLLNGNLQFFPAPLSGTSTATATFSNGGATNNGQIAFMSSGGFWAANVSNRVNRFNPPFSNASTPAAFVTDPGMVSDIGVAIDAAQNLYIANAGAGTTSNLYVYAPPYTGTPIITPPVAATAYRKATVSATQLFVCSIAGATGRVDVYTLPITATSTPAFAITTGMNIPEAVALDAAGNLYVGDLGDSTVRVYTPPFSATSAPTVALTVGPSPFAIFGIAIGK